MTVFKKPCPVLAGPLPFRGKTYTLFLTKMFENSPVSYDDKLKRFSRLLEVRSES